MTGLLYPVGLLLDGNDLYVGSQSGENVGKYNATTGVAINANFISGVVGPSSFALGVPEPGSASLLMLGGATLMRRRREAKPDSQARFSAPTPEPSQWKKALHSSECPIGAH